MTFITTIVAFLVALGSLIVVHELGHYLVARLCDVKVLRFSVGFGKPLWTRTLGPDRTEWVIAAFPLGGYVKMLDEREGAGRAAKSSPRAFNRQSVWRRFAIVLAGPVANFLLAIVALLGALHARRPRHEAGARAEPPAAHGCRARGLRRRRRASRRIGDEPRCHLAGRALGAPAARGAARAASPIEVRDAARASSRSASSISRGSPPADLDSDFLRALGLARLQPPLPPVIGNVVARRRGRARGPARRATRSSRSTTGRSTAGRTS